MSVKRYAKQLRYKQASLRRAAIKRTKPPSAKMQTIISWVKNGRPEWMSIGHWQAVIRCVPRKAGAKIRDRMQAKTLGICTRSY